MSNHKLKTWPRFFHAVRRWEKPFEIRKNDREEKFQVGDTLTLEEFVPCQECNGTGRLVRFRIRGGGEAFDPCECMKSKYPKGRYTGQWIIREVTFILDSEFGLEPGFVALGLKECEPKLSTQDSKP